MAESSRRMSCTRDPATAAAAPNCISCCKVSDPTFSDRMALRMPRSSDAGAHAGVCNGIQANKALIPFLMPGRAFRTGRKAASAAALPDRKPTSMRRPGCNTCGPGSRVSSAHCRTGICAASALFRFAHEVGGALLLPGRYRHNIRGGRMFLVSALRISRSGASDRADRHHDRRIPRRFFPPAHPHPMPDAAVAPAILEMTLGQGRVTANAAGPFD